MKFRFPLLVALALALNSCSSSDDYVPLIQPELPAEGSSRVRSITHEGSMPQTYDWTFNYDANYLVSAEGKLLGDTDGTYKYRSQLYYSPNGVTIVNSNGKNMAAVMDAKGNIVELAVNNNEYYFEYTAGRLTSWKKVLNDENFGHEESATTGKLTYNAAGNLVRIDHVGHDGVTTVVTLTPSTTLNKNGILPPTLSSQMGCFGFEHLYYGGMLGKPSTHLVKTIKVDNAKGTANDYQIDCTYSFFPETGDTKLCNFTYKGEATSVIYKYE